ncbi:hypothetical protein As57867_022161, partial [Aphanomyces stellatus]
MVNPLTRCLEDYALPPYATMCVEDIVPAVRTAIAEMELDLTSVEDDVAASEDLTWESVMDRLEIIDDPLSRLWHIVVHLESVANSAALRAAKATVQTEVIRMESRRAQSTLIFQALERLRGGPAFATYSPEQQRLVEMEIQKATLSGVGLIDNAKDRFNDIHVRLKDVRTQFANNVLDAIQAYELLVYDKSQLAGVSDSILASIAQNAVAAGHRDATAATGPWKLSLETPVYLPIMRTCTNRTLRQELYRAHMTKASASPHDNAPVMVEILQLRRERARLLGFESFAELSLADKMAPSVKAVEAMLQDLVETCLPR